MGPAAKPDLPPEEPTMANRILYRFFALSNSAIFVVVFGVAFLLSLIFSNQASKVLLGFAYLYHLLSEAYRTFF